MSVSAAQHLLRGPRHRDAARVGNKRSDVLRRVVESCTEAQRAFVMDPHRSLALLTARGWGKTTGGAMRRFVRTGYEMHGAPMSYVALSRPQAKSILWTAAKEFFAEYEIPARFYEQELRIVFKETGSEIQFYGADDTHELEKQRGIKKAGVVVDEGASFRGKILEDLVERIIGPRLSDLRGWIAIVGTPGHILSGLFYEITRNSSSRSRHWRDRDSAEWRGKVCTCPGACTAFEWSLHGGPLTDNTAMPHMWTEALQKKEAKGWGDDNPIWQREYLGRWVADDTGRVFGRLREYDDAGADWNVWTPAKATAANPFGLPDGHEWRYVYGLDLGFKDPVGLQVLAYSDTSPTLYQVYEYERRGMTVTPLATLLKGVQSLTGPPDAAWADLAGSGGMILGELASVHGLVFKPAEKKNKLDAIELVNSDFADGRLKLLKGSKTLEQMLALQWDGKEGPVLKEMGNQANHLSDALIYARKGALHHYSKDAAPPKPKPGTKAAEAAWEAESIAKLEAQVRGERMGEPEGPSYDESEWAPPWQSEPPLT